MRKACIVVHEFYQKNRLFDLDDIYSNRDNCLYFFYQLKTALEKQGYLLATQDIHTIEESEIVIYNEMPKELPKIEDREKSYLLIFESELISKSNWDFHNHSYFNKIFTWNDTIVDNIKYFKFNFSFQLPQEISLKFFSEKKLCTLIAGNKVNSDPRELYSKRVEAIRWFEKNHENDFDLYGIGWEQGEISNQNKYLRKLKKLLKIKSRSFSSYKGKIDSKREVLSGYKFAICYENAKDIPGYITEKIFDCFFAGCVPVYWGAPNVSDYIPRECYIDKTKFESYEELYSYLSNMREEEYTRYIENIKKFLKRDEIRIFSGEINTQNVVQNILKEEK